MLAGVARDPDVATHRIAQDRRIKQRRRRLGILP